MFRIGAYAMINGRKRGRKEARKGEAERRNLA